MATYELQISIPTGGTSIPCGSLQSWEIENTDAANSIFVNEQVMPPSAATSGGKEVAAGLARILYFDPAENPLIYFKAATAAVLINIRKQTFRSRVLWDLARLVSAISQQVADSFWQRVSATVIKLGGAYTEARANAIRNKTAGTGLGIYTDAATTGIALRPGTAPTPVASTVRLFSDDGTDIISVETTANQQFGIYTNSVARVVVTDSPATPEIQVRNGASVIAYNGNGSDPRHTLNATERVLHTPVAGGGIDSVKDTIELPIANTLVIAVGDTVLIVGGAAAVSNRVQQAQTANVTLPVLGVATAGGTGNAGGTVFARVAFGGIALGVLADAAGVTLGQFGKPGTTTLNRVESQTTPSLITFGRILTTAASGVATGMALRGMG